MGAGVRFGGVQLTLHYGDSSPHVNGALAAKLANGRFQHE